MPTPWEDYKQQVLSLPLDREYPITSLTEARAEKRELIRLQKELRQIKRMIEYDIKTIRADYAVKIAEAGSDPHNWISLFNGRGAAGKARADEKRTLSHERDRALQPYSGLKLAIDAQILEFEKSKTQADLMIAQLTARS